MTNVQMLVERVVNAINAEGYEVYWVNHMHSNNESEMTEKTFDVYETFRMNHRDEENVSVTIEVCKWELEGSGCASGKRLVRINVPKNASHRVILNRVLAAIKAYKNG